MSADTLTVTSRAFYERSKAKVAISIIVAASGLMLLGFCSVAGGNAASNNEIYQTTGAKQSDDHNQNSIQALAGGYGEFTHNNFLYCISNLGKLKFIPRICCICVHPCVHSSDFRGPIYFAVHLRLQQRKEDDQSATGDRHW